MAIQRRQKSFTLAGSSLIVWEASWETSMAQSAMETEARTLKEKLSGSPDPDRLYFHEFIYAPLAAASTGEVPTLDQAFELPSSELDAWYEVVREVDPENYGEERTVPETVTFRDGSTLTILPAYLPSVMMRLHRLEREAEALPASESVTTETFRQIYWPRLAACSIGDLPTMEEARTQWPTSELDKWYQAARRVNPQLFLPLEEIALANKARAEQAQKKSKRSRSRSSAS